MRILYLMTEPFGVGGVQSDLLTLAREFTRRGHRVFVATAPGPLLGELEAAGGRHLAMDFNYKGLRGLLRTARSLRAAVRAHDIDIVAPQSVRSTMTAHAVLRLPPLRYLPPLGQRRLPIVATVHNIHNPAHFRYAGAILTRCADFVICESHYERDRLLASGLSETRSTVIHSGIDTQRFAPKPPDPALAKRYGLDLEREFVFGIVARLSEEKGHSYLLDAFAQLHGKSPHARLLVVGDGPLLPAVKAQANELGLGSAVVFTGMQRDIPAHLALLDTFVLSSTRESFPLAAREAMAAGKPVIAPRIGGCPEVVEHGVTGYLFESGNVSELSLCMANLLDEGTCTSMGRAARERVERLFSQRAWIHGDEQAYLRRIGRLPGEEGATTIEPTRGQPGENALSRHASEAYETARGHGVPSSDRVRLSVREGPDRE